MEKLLVVVLAPCQFPVLQVFPDLPDNLALIKAMVMLRQLVFPSRDNFITAVAISAKRTKQPKSGSTFIGKVFRPWGMRIYCPHFWDVLPPKLTLNPKDSHKPMYYNVNNDHHRDLLPLGH